MYTQCKAPQHCDILNLSPFTSNHTVFFWTTSMSSGPMGCSSATREGRWRLQGASAIWIPTVSIGGVLPRSGRCSAHREAVMCFVLDSREHCVGVALLRRLHGGGVVCTQAHTRRREMLSLVGKEVVHMCAQHVAIGATCFRDCDQAERMPCDPCQ
jgi:hypothetical protein